jgi:hypothetical protein
MDPTIWGPKLWFISHAIAFNYPENPTQADKDNHKQWFELYKFMIMCDVCRKHYAEHLLKNPIDNNLNSRDDLIKWVWQLHNTVNESLGKAPWTFEQMMDHYTKIFSKKCSINANKCSATPPIHNQQNNKKPSSNINYIILLLMNFLIIAILFLIYFKKKNTL